MPINAIDLSSPIKRHRPVDWIEKTKIQLFVVFKKHISLEKTKTDRRWKTVHHANRSLKEAGDFKEKQPPILSIDFLQNLKLIQWKKWSI
jgi:hypothetical protein